MRIIRSLLLIVGLACLLVYSYTYVERLESQAYAAWLFDRDVKTTPLPATAVPVEVVLRAPLLREAIIGKIAIPKLNLTAMVREGTDAKILRLAVGHLPSTPLPGQPGNVAVAGHRDTFFRHLGELQIGDSIGFASTDGDFTYEVESLRIVEPEDVSVLAPSQEKVLTMVTCYPFYYIGNAPKRFIVRAKQVAK